MKNVGLILEGGGMRGLYTCGVLDYFLLKDVNFSSIYGVSAGACHACSYKSKQYGRAMKTSMDFLDDSRYASMYSFLKTGDYFGVDLSYNLIPNNLLPFDYEAFVKNPAKLNAIITDCDTGEAVCKPVNDLRNDMDLIRASSSLPLLSRFVKIDGGKYLDGGIADSIPIDFSIADGNSYNVIILTQHNGFRKQANKMISLLKFRYRNYPELVESIRNRHIKYNKTLDLIYDLKRVGKALVIQPNAPVSISRLEKNRDKLVSLYESGHHDAEAQYSEVIEFLS